MPAGLLGLGAGRDGRFSRGGIELGSLGIWILIDGAGKGIEDWQQAGCLHPESAEPEAQFAALPISEAADCTGRNPV